MINREKAMDIWGKQFGNKISTKDYHGRDIKKSAYGLESSHYCWTLDHVCPKKVGGDDSYYNLLPVHIVTNREKDDNYTNFELLDNKGNLSQYQVKKIKDNRKHGYNIVRDPYNNPVIVATTAKNL